MKSIPLLLIAASLAGAPVFAAEGKATAKAKTEARAASAKAKGPRTAPRWQFGSERPCDSTACRPVRFAWSPTAPGS